MPPRSFGAIVRPAYRDLEVLHAECEAKRPRIDARLADFRHIGRMPDERLFEELCFCILAVQSKARPSEAAVSALREAGLLWSGHRPEVASFLRHRTRFHNHKAALKDAREWLVREVDGLGLKEASHFLRNTGRGEDLAILDRHILRNLVRHGVIRRMPHTLTAKRYLEIEAQMKRFSHDVEISMAMLDLIFWSRETGEIFK